MSVLIAEIGNNHFGDMELAKSMIVQAMDSGATMVKMQAIDDNTIGSMPKEFYKQCALETEQYIELIEYAKFVGIELFYTIVSNKHAELFLKQKHFKISGQMSGVLNELIHKNDTKGYNEFQEAFGPNSVWHSAHVFMSLRKENLELVKEFPYWSPLYVSDYLVTNPQLENIDKLRKLAKHWQVVGYSDHTFGTMACITAIEEYNVKIIEKHFTDEKMKNWNGQVFRDTVHGITAKELSAIAKTMRRMR